jgi:PAC2 family
MDTSVRWLDAAPQLDDPVLLVMLSGWIDAAGAAARAIEAIGEESAASPFVTFDDDVYIDYRARRPLMELRDGLNTVLQWSHINLAAGHDQTGHDLLLLTGPEPDMAWHRFADAAGDLAVELGVSKMVGFGAYPFTAPHTRTPRVSVTSPSQDVLARVPFLRTSVDVPGGMVAVLEHAMHDRDIPSLSVWAQVPHYITTAAYPAASVALIDALRDAADVVIDGTDVRQESVALRQRLDQLVAGNEDHQRMVTQLEQLYDAADDDASTTGLGSTLEMRSGDELAAELEQFLRDQD